MKRLQYAIYKYINKQRHFLYFDYEEWIVVEQLKKTGQEYYDEYGVLCNVIFK